jgi:hypothetical protein
MFMAKTTSKAGVDPKKRKYHCFGDGAFGGTFVPGPIFFHEASEAHFSGTMNSERSCGSSRTFV